MGAGLRLAPRQRATVTALIGLMCLSSVAAEAGSTPKWSVRQLATFADLVVIGRVEGIQAAWDTGAEAIYTHVTVSVHHALKGSVPGGQLVVKQLGGRVGEVGLHVSDQAAFDAGEDVLLFLEVRPRDGTLYTTALWQGKWTLDRGLTAGGLAKRAQPGHGLSGSVTDVYAVPQIEDLVARAPRRHDSGPAIKYLPAIAADAATVGVASQAFTLLGPLRYLFSPFVDVQQGGQPGLPGGGLTQIQSAMARWNGAGSSFRYQMGSTNNVPRCTTEELGNLRVTISFLDPCREMSNGGGTLAIGGSYYLFSGAGTIDGTIFNRATEGFIVMNDGDTALSYLTRPGCFEDVTTHELGHVLGLGHSVDPNAIMFASVNTNCGAGARGLGADDLAGLNHLYGANTPRGIAPSTAPTDVQVTVNGTITVSVRWGALARISAAAEAEAASNYRLEFRAGHQEGGMLVGSFATSATSFLVAIPPDASGDYNVVVIPINPDGEGAPSPRRDFTICGTTVPPAVQALTASVSGGMVRVTWLSSPGATSYRGFVGTTPGTNDLYPLTDFGNATQVQAPIGPTFRGWLRVFALSSCGISAPADVFISGS